MDFQLVVESCGAAARVSEREQAERAAFSRVCGDRVAKTRRRSATLRAGRRAKPVSRRVGCLATTYFVCTPPHLAMPVERRAAGPQRRRRAKKSAVARIRPARDAIRGRKQTRATAKWQRSFARRRGYSRSRLELPFINAVVIVVASSARSLSHSSRLSSSSLCVAASHSSSTCAIHESTKVPTFVVVVFALNCGTRSSTASSLKLPQTPQTRLKRAKFGGDRRRRRSRKMLPSFDRNAQRRSREHKGETNAERMKVENESRAVFCRKRVED